MEFTHTPFRQRPATITIWHYFKSAKCYTRSLAIRARGGMLFLKRQFSSLCRFFRGRDSIVEQENCRSFLYTLRN
jgi:hypothetical protein